MPTLSEQIRESLGIELVEQRGIGAQHGYRRVSGTLADGRPIFAKVAPGPSGARCLVRPLT
jgi:hypothetical protein